MKKITEIVLALVGAAAAAQPAISRAQEADLSAVAAEPSEAAPYASKEARRNRLVEEIVVTAQKREENLQDIPLSVQAFSGEQLDARGITDPKGLTATTPGLQFNQSVGYSIIYIRGVGTDAFIPSADGSVATYIDGVYYPLAQSAAATLGTIERIEVLKGPQGTLFGRNSTGGAINIITRKPKPGGPLETSLTYSYESFDTNRFRVWTNIPLTDTLAISVSGLHHQGDSYYKRSASSPLTVPIPEDLSRGAQAQLTWEPTDELSINLAANYTNMRNETNMMLPMRDIKPVGQALGVREEKDYEFGGDFQPYIDFRVRVASADIKYDLSWFDTRLIVADQAMKGPEATDFDGSSAPLVGFEATGQFADITTAELQFISDDATPDWLQWIGGLFYIKSSAGFDPFQLYVGPNLIQYLRAPTGPLTGITSPLVTLLSDVPGLGNVLDSYVDDPATLQLAGILDTKSTAAFFQTTAKLTDTLSLTLGGRYQEETRKLVKSQTGLYNPQDKTQVIPLIPFAKRSASSNNFSPKVVLDYAINDDSHTYASFSQGFKSGTFNIIAIYAPTQYINPERVRSYELGYKSTLIDGALRFNAAVFQNEIDNLQVQTVSLTSGGAVRFENAGSARIRGADFDITWQVLAETLPGLVLAGGGAFLDGEYTDYKNGSGYDEETGVFFGGTSLLTGGGVTPGRDFTGHETVRTPKFTGNVSLNYATGLGSGTVETAVDFYYNSGFYFSAQNYSDMEQKAYSLLDARISYLHDPWGTRFTVFAKNLNDARYQASTQELDFGVGKLLAPPRTYGVKLQWDF